MLIKVNKSKEDNMYNAYMEYRSPLCTHEVNVVFTMKNNEIEEIINVDEASYGSWEDWDKEDIENDNFVIPELNKWLAVNQNEIIEH